jgi:hypothetical protein
MAPTSGPAFPVVGRGAVRDERVPAAAAKDFGRTVGRLRVPLPLVGIPSGAASCAPARPASASVIVVSAWASGGMAGHGVRSGP